MSFVWSFLSVTLASLVLEGTVLGAENEFRINSMDDLITFSIEVNSGTSYSGTTVYLGSDITFDSSLSQQFEPIGNSTTYSFQGYFDGQGHIINNLTLSSYSQYFGGIWEYKVGDNQEHCVIQFLFLRELL